MMECRTFIAAALRTPFGALQGQLAHYDAYALGVHLGRGLLNQCKVASETLDALILAQVLSAGAGALLARRMASAIGLVPEAVAYRLEMGQGSGLKALMDACAQVRSGEVDSVLVLAVESLSNAAHIVKLRTPSSLSQDFSLQDSLSCDGCLPTFSEAKAHLAPEEWAYHSRQKATRAQHNGAFRREILPLPDVACDEYPVETLETLYAPRADGACALLLVSEHFLHRQHLQPLAEVIAYGQGGAHTPERLLSTAVAQALERAGLSLHEMSALALDETAATQTLVAIEALAKEHELSALALCERCNLRGGDLALGLPLAAASLRLALALSYDLQKEEYGLVASQVGATMGLALILRSIGCA